MTSLNKAFIKAYRKSATAAPASAAPRPHFDVAKAKSPAAVVGERKITIAPPTVATPTVRLAEAEAAPPLPAELELPPVVAPPKPITVFEPPHASVRPPHANFADPPRTAVATVTAAPSLAPLVSATAPTSDVPPVNPRPVILPMTGPSPVWRPVFEVNNFVWPELTNVLLDTAAAQFRAAATDLVEASRRHRKLIAVTASRRGEGCTVVTLALAKALAEQQQRVILVDAHFDAPGLADSLGVAAQAGWEDALTGEKPLSEALVESLEDRLIVLPLREPAAADWRLSVARLKSSFDELRRHCDLILIDAGPVGELGDRRHLLSWAAPCRVDRALVVRDLRTTSDDETSEIERRLHGCGIAQWNFVENFAA
jgi:Mrp family chromosome partitioning ATPase